MSMVVRSNEEEGWPALNITLQYILCIILYIYAQRVDEVE